MNQVRIAKFGTTTFCGTRRSLRPSALLTEVEPYLYQIGSVTKSIIVRRLLSYSCIAEVFYSQLLIHHHHLSETNHCGIVIFIDVLLDDII